MVNENLRPLQNIIDLSFKRFQKHVCCEMFDLIGLYTPNKKNLTQQKKEEQNLISVHKVKTSSFVFQFYFTICLTRYYLAECNGKYVKQVKKFCLVSFFDYSIKYVLHLSEWIFQKIWEILQKSLGS